MRAVRRLRSISTDYVLPLVLAALVLRALIPAGFMPGVGPGSSLTAMLCNAPSDGAPRTETIEIPGAGGPVAAGMHCDFCLVPVLGAAFSLPAVRPVVAVAAFLAPSSADAPPSRYALDRAQIPRAPPLA